MFRLRYPPLRHAALTELWAFVLALRGQYETCQFFLPTRFWPTKGAGGTGLVNDAGGSPVPNQIGDRTIYTDNWVPSSTPAKKGDWIKYGGHSKVYMATQDCPADGSGIATLVHEPALLADPADDERVYIGAEHIPFTVSLASDINEVFGRPMAGGAGAKFAIELSLVEVYP